MRFLFATFAMLLAIAATAAETPAESKAGAQRGVCREEVKKICGDMKPGDGKYKQCLDASHDKLSPACREQLDRGQGRIEAAHKACQADTQKFCAGTQPGDGRLHQCLKKNEAALSPDCRAALQHKPRPRPGKDPS